MKHTKSKKLSLTTNTIRALTDADLNRAAGGALYQTYAPVCQRTGFHCAPSAVCSMLVTGTC